MAGIGQFISTEWSELKMLVDSGFPLYYSDMNEQYNILASDTVGVFYKTTIFKQSPVPAGSDQEDFEDNYQSKANKPYTTPVDLDVTAAPGCPVLSPTLKLLYSGTDITAGSGYTTAYSYSGTGKFFGFVFDYNSDQVRTKLTIDGNVIFELSMDEIEALQSFDGDGCDDSQDTGNGVCGFIKKSAGNRLNFCPPCAIKYTSEVKIEIKRTGSSSKKLKDQIVILTKES